MFIGLCIPLTSLGPVDPGWTGGIALPPHVSGGPIYRPPGYVSGGPIYPPVDPGYGRPPPIHPVDPGYGVRPPVDPGWGHGRPLPPHVGGGPIYPPIPPVGGADDGGGWAYSPVYGWVWVPEGGGGKPQPGPGTPDAEPK